MDAKLYNAAVLGDIDFLVQNKDKLVDESTPNNNTVLHLVSLLGKGICVTEILKMHPLLIRRVNSNGDSALHLAARNGNYHVVQELIRCAKSLDKEVESGIGFDKVIQRMRNECGDTPLFDAVRHNHFDVVEFLAQEDPKFSHTANNIGETPLYIAAEKGFDDSVAVILEKCTLPGYGGPCGRTALHAAIISNGAVSTRKLLVWKQSLINERDERGWSPLHFAAFFGRAYRVSQLLTVDKSITYIADNDMNTALHIAATRGEIDTAQKIILDCPDCCEMVNDSGQNILHIAFKYKKSNFAQYILRNYEAISATLVTQKDVDGNTPLHLMAASTCFAPLLVDHAMVDKNSFNNKNLTPLDLIEESEVKVHPVLIKNLLSAAGATLGFRNIRSIEEKDQDPNPLGKDKIREEIRKIGDSYNIVATLIATVTFTAGFTMPGGYHQSGDLNQGMAVLSRKPAFQAFIISDTIALLLSSIAIFLIFVSLWIDNISVLAKIQEHVASLILAAIGAMMVAFSTGTYVVLGESSALAITTCVIGVISIPIYFSNFYKIFNGIFNSDKVI
ncbi:unnamed protein product [Ilex paraguariensis]|uniref:PGG domain-containing protein n=1 Tax=Ilex paraguariensis TaxID=185542 RepID=A0ABC8SIE2_9AQUA